MGMAVRKERPTHPSLGPGRRCRGVPFRPASSIAPRSYASIYARLFALLMLAGDLAPVSHWMKWEPWSVFARFSSVSARSSHLSAKASRRVLGSRTRVGRKSHCVPCILPILVLLHRRVPCGSQSRNTEEPQSVPVRLRVAGGGNAFHPSGVFARRRSTDASEARSLRTPKTA